MSAQSTFYKHPCRYYLNNDDQIRSRFCTCHDSSAVVTCAKLWPDLVNRIMIKAKANFSRFNYELINPLWKGPPKFWKWVNILHVSACFHPGFHTLDLGRVFKYPFQIRHNEKCDIGRKNTINFAFTKRVLCHSVEKGVFFSPRIREKCACVGIISYYSYDGRAIPAYFVCSKLHHCNVI